MRGRAERSPQPRSPLTPASRRGEASRARLTSRVTDARSAMLPVSFLQMPPAARSLHPLVGNPIKALARGTVGAANPPIVIFIPAPVARGPDKAGSLDDGLDTAWRRRRLIVDRARACRWRRIGTWRRSELARSARRPVAWLEMPAAIRTRFPATSHPREAGTLRDVGATDPFVTAAIGIPSPVSRSPDVARSHNGLFDPWRWWGCLDDDFLRRAAAVVCISRRSCGVSVGSRLFVVVGVPVFLVGGARGWCRCWHRRRFAFAAG